MIMIKSPRELDIMRSNGRLLGEIVEQIVAIIEPNITTLKIDKLAEELIIKAGAIPSFKGYRGYPASTCLSVNEEVVHGIPSKRILKEGDIIGIDLGLIKNGYHSDTALTVPIGNITEKTKHLLRITREALFKGIEQCQVGNRLSDIGNAIQTWSEAVGYSVVRAMVGHGIGRKLHEEPQIPNYGKSGKGPRLKAGMVFAIEPMVNIGTYDIKTLKDGWTVITKDKMLSAHFEHTVAITENGPDIFTLRPEEVLLQFA